LGSLDVFVLLGSPKDVSHLSRSVASGQSSSKIKSKYDKLEPEPESLSFELLLSNLNNFCKNCGNKLEQNHTICPSCKTNLESKEGKGGGALDEIKKDFLNLSTKTLSKAKEISADFANEAKKINETRRQVTDSVEYKNTSDKKEAIKNGLGLFWGNLTGKQKIIVLGVPFFLFISVMAIFESTEQDHVWSHAESARIRTIMFGLNLKAGVPLEGMTIGCELRGLKKYYSAVDAEKAIHNFEVGSLLDKISSTCNKNKNSYIDVSPPVGSPDSVKKGWYQ
jgi:ribosomal protein L32